MTPIDLLRLRDILRDLGTNVIAEVSVFKAADRLVARRQEYVVRPSFNLWYSGDPRLGTFESKTVEEYTLLTKDLEDFLEKQVFTQQTYTAATQLLKDGGVDAGLVRNYASSVAYESAVGHAPGLDQYIEILVRDVSDAAVEYAAKLWITGITLGEKVIHISDSLSFRLPTREDFQEKIRVEALPYVRADFIGRINFSCVADCKVLGRRLFSPSAVCRSALLNSSPFPAGIGFSAAIRLQSGVLFGIQHWEFWRATTRHTSFVPLVG